MKIIITGATGYIGSRLTNFAMNAGMDVVSMSRHAPSGERISWIKYDLTDNKIADLPIDAVAVIHLATNTFAHHHEEFNELRSAKLLIQAANKIGAKFLFVSSQTAYPNAPTTYGRTKWRIEQEVMAAGGTVVRPGQVYGGEAQGLFGTLVGVVRRIPILPAFYPVVTVQPIHVDDLAIALLRIAQLEGGGGGIVSLGSSEPIPFTHFLSAIARHRVRRRRWFVPVPVPLIKFAGMLCGRRLSERLGFDRLTSLFNLPRMDTADDLKRFGVPMRSLDAGMHPSGDIRRRQLVQEGWILMHYLLKERPDGGLLRRYMRAVERTRTNQGLIFPDCFLKFPVLVALFDETSYLSSSEGAELAWRLDAATLLVEATPRGALRFLGLGQRAGMLIGVARICRAIAAEVFWRALRLVGLLFFRRYKNGVESR
ncbi:NAD(P)-dependent oxidoreductase [Noviherbaspirillum sp. UKPF54]|uniref:NAD-dependent epimerase/dehydratase family protein n=1 Tax=Noviherbaspirillum sp. UKPF54 TaxID=2601898 RepID=UPI0011B1AAAE|nr:NAD-dependent epimerase/dehydratase family protein [Noviherbaspirillum sp. UKPF54]QDZ28853.1 NAD-dependent epimerase/dehydratase family protein [Noviherbaspirillum sp. UKPF54]